MAYFGEWLAKRRMELGLTLRDLSEIVNVASPKVSAWERGLEDPPYQVRDACWDALKRDGEIPPLDPPPCLSGRAPVATATAAAPAPPRPRSIPKTWVEQWAVTKGTTLDEVLKAFGMSPTVKYQWRTGKTPSPATQWKIAQFLEIPDDVARANGWNPNPAKT